MHKMTKLQTFIVLILSMAVLAPVVVIAGALNDIGGHIKRQRCLAEQAPRPYYCPTPAATESPKP